MAKKTAPKKKAVAKTKAVVKTAKSAKEVKTAKQAKLVVKVVAKAIKPVAKTIAKAEVKEAAKPSLMTKKGKVAKSEVAEPVEVKRAETVVSMLETDSSAAAQLKVEKISKVKPVKVDRGNVNDEKAKWTELNKKYGKEKAFSYKMTETYPSLVPLQHKVLGWGFILTNDNDRLEVLFENGIRMLISNYKS